jgi:hypothetical protein
VFLSALALTTLLFQGPTDGGMIRQDILLNLDGSEPRLMIRQPQEALAQPKKGPRTFGVNKIPFEFEWITWGFAKVGKADQHDLRLRVYSQERKPEGDSAQAVTRMMLRLWDLNFQRLGIDHAPRTPDGRRLINVYVTYGGKAGGEQFKHAEYEANTKVSTNNIYIYDMASFTDPLEMAREVAHEYGHATLPEVGGYTEPEYWANGYVGEKLYLTWIRDLLAANLLMPDDFMGVTKEQLDGWVSTNVDPLILAAAAKPPTMGALAKRDKAGLDLYVGLTVYMGQLLPNKVFARSLKLIGSQNARDYPGAIALAMEEPETVALTVPAALKGKEFWVPTGTGRLTGAKILAIEGGWTKISTTADTVTVKRRA